MKTNKIICFCLLALYTICTNTAFAGFDDGHAVHAGESPQGYTATRFAAADADGDGLDDYEDNCSEVANADQRDTDGDGYGNVCDADFNNDGQTNATDLGLMRVAFFAQPGDANWNANVDINGDNIINVIDLGALRTFFFSRPGPSGMSCAGTTPCPLPRLTFDWPMPGDDADEWVINNYVDLDNGAGILDYRGGTKSYDGHRGIDIDVPTFRAMDNDFPILAAAQGVVLALEDTNFDRNTSCVGQWNFVTIGHPNGWQTIYGHLKRNSVVVNVGDIVQPGDVLGVVGSSGCSTAPHLHFQTMDDDGNVIEPFQLGMWNNTPVYATPIGYMDMTVYPNAINNVGMIKDPPPNAPIVEPGGTVGVGLSIGGGQAGDTLIVQVRKGTAVVAQSTINITGTLRHSYWWRNFTLPASASGAHRINVFVNGVFRDVHNFHVDQILTGFRQVRHHVPQANYQALFNTMTVNGFRPIWVDGYEVNGSTYFNAIFDKSPVASWTSAHHQTGASFQTFFNEQTAAGRRLVHIDSYRLGSSVRYVSIFADQPGTSWTAYHGVSTATHQSQFNTLTGQGFKPVVISLVQTSSGPQVVTALYNKDPVGGFVALANLTSAQYQSAFNTQIAAGRRLSYINVYELNGVANFSAVWNSVQPSAWVARHNLSISGFQTEFDTWEGQGLATRMISGYESGGAARFAGYWTN